MKDQLKKTGLDLNLVVVNMTGMADMIANLISKGDFPIFQDTDLLGAWLAHNGAKDDLIVYDKYGKLFQFLPYSGTLDTSLGGEEGWNNVKKAWTDAAAVP